MQLVALSVRLTVTLEEGGEGTALALMHAGEDAAEAPELLYLVSFPNEPRPRLVKQDQIVKQRVA